MELHAVSRVDGRGIAVKRVSFRIAGLKLKSIWTGENTALERVVAVVDLDQDDRCDHRSYANGNADHLAGGWANGPGRLAGRGRRGARTEKGAKSDKGCDSAVTVRGALCNGFLRLVCRRRGNLHSILHGLTDSRGSGGEGFSGRSACRRNGAGRNSTRGSCVQV